MQKRLKARKFQGAFSLSFITAKIQGDFCGYAGGGASNISAMNRQRTNGCCYNKKRDKVLTDAHISGIISV